MKIVIARTIDIRYLSLIPMYFYTSSDEIDTKFYRVFNLRRELKYSERQIIAATQRIDAPRHEYPPVRTQFKALKELVKLDYDWYVRCDPDTAINEKMLLRELRTLNKTDDPVVYGKFGYGREDERRFMKMSHYLQGGFCDTFNKAVAVRLRQTGILDSCLQWTFTHIPSAYTHSDSEISRCMLRHNITLYSWPKRLLHPTYETNSKHTLSNPTLRQMCSFKSEALFAHPAKTPPVYYIRSLLLRQDRMACRTKYSEKKPRVALPMHAFMLNGTMPASDFFKKAVNVVAKPIEQSRFLTRGEMGYKHTMKRIIRRAINSNISYFATFDNDVAFHENGLEYLTRDWVCIEETLRKGGVVMLGAAVWTKKGQSRVLQTKSTCRPYMKGVLGSFAVLWSTAAAEYVYRYNNDVNLPFDHTWEILQTLNIPVKFIHPPIAVHNVNHKASTTDPSRPRRSFKFWGVESDFRVNWLKRSQNMANSTRAY